MGANNVLPSVPTFTAGAPSIANLNALSYAVSFLCDNDTRPAWSFFMYTGTQSIVAATWTNVSYDHTAFDSDGVQSYPYAQIVTQGYYALTACVQIEANANTADMYTGAFLFTAGANNPHYTTGTTQFFGYRGGKASSTAQAAADNAVCLADLTPMVLYPGDKLSVSVYLSAAHTLDINQNTSYIQGRFATKFTGNWIRTGS
jgi:hypothetical protein